MGDINDARRATELPSYDSRQMHAWAQRQVICGALDAEVLDRAAMILKLRSRNTILNRAFRKALTEMAAWARAEAARR